MSKIGLCDSSRIATDQACCFDKDTLNSMYLKATKADQNFLLVTNESPHGDKENFSSKLVNNRSLEEITSKP